MRNTRPTFASSPTLSTLLALSGRLVQERIGRDLEPIGVSYPQAAALIRLWLRDGEMPQAEMIRSLALSRTSVTQVLNDLTEQRLIERHPVAGDARRLVVRLTEEGQELEPMVLRVFERVDADITSTLAEEDREGAFKVLRALLEGIRQDRRP